MNGVSKHVFSMQVFLTIVLFISIPLTLSAQRFDADSDGLDDLLLVSIDDEDNLDHFILSSEGGYLTNILEVQDFGENGDHLIPGFWTGSTLELGFVTLSNKDLSWTIRNSDGEQENVTFGKASNVFGATDLNGDRIWDIFTITKRGNANIRLSPFGDNPSEVSVKFPVKAAKRIKQKGGKAAIVRNDDGTDDIAILYRSKVRNNRRRVKRYTLIRRDESGNSQTIRLDGVPSKELVSFASFQLNDESQGFVVVEQPSRRSRRVRIFNGEGTLLFSNTYTGNTVVVGKFIADVTGEQFAVKSGTTLTLVSPFQGGATTDIEVGEGVIADSYNVNLASSSSSGGNSGGSSPGLNSRCRSIASFGAGRLWKPESDVNDNRGGKPVMLFTGGSKGSRSGKAVYDREGNVVCSAMTFKASNEPGINNNADHFFSGWLGGCSLTGGQMASRARANTGSSQVYVEWKNGQCLSVPDPRNRYGGI